MTATKTGSLRQVDLTEIIKATWRQVHGSDERELLSQWLERNMGQPQAVYIDTGLLAVMRRGRRSRRAGKTPDSDRRG